MRREEFLILGCCNASGQLNILIESGNNRIIKHVLIDVFLQPIILRSAEYPVIATTTLNGDYSCNVLPVRAGGIGLVPVANIGDETAIFETGDRTAPRYRLNRV